MSKKRKEEKQKASTRKLIGIKDIGEASLITYDQGELVYFLVKVQTAVQGNEPVFLFFVSGLSALAFLAAVDEVNETVVACSAGTC